MKFSDLFSSRRSAPQTLSELDRYTAVFQAADAQIKRSGDFADKCLNRIITIGKWTLGCATVLISVGSGLFAYFFHKDVSELRQDIHDRLGAIERFQTNQFRERMELFGTVISNRVENQFQERNIRALVESVAAQQSSTLFASLISDQVQAFTNRLAERQGALSEELRLQRLAAQSRSGKFTAYEELKAAQTNGPSGPIAVMLFQDVQLYLLDRITATASQEPRDPNNGGPLVIGADEVVVKLASDNFADRIYAGRTVFHAFSEPLHSKLVGALCSALERETNTFVIGQICHDLRAITLEPLIPLEKTAFLEWWKTHQSDAKYQSVYTWLYLGLKQGRIADPEFLKQVVAQDRAADFLRYKLILHYLRSGQVAEAQTELDAMRKISNSKWALLSEAVVLFARDREVDATKALALTIKDWPQMEAIARQELDSKRVDEALKLNKQ